MSPNWTKNYSDDVYRFDYEVLFLTAGGPSISMVAEGFFPCIG